VGAAIGVSLGIGIAGILRVSFSLPMDVTLWSLVLGVAVGTITGIVAGVYPASRAARLDPIAAMRQE
jgi:putative ABC transport system permease protein